MMRVWIVLGLLLATPRSAFAEEAPTRERVSQRTKLVAELVILEKREMRAMKALRQWSGPDNSCGEGFGDLRKNGEYVKLCQICKGPGALLKVEWGFADGIGLTYCSGAHEIDDRTLVERAQAKISFDEPTRVLIHVALQARERHVTVRRALADLEGDQVLTTTLGPSTTLV